MTMNRLYTVFVYYLKETCTELHRLWISVETKEILSRWFSVSTEINIYILYLINAFSLKFNI